jgi:GxxExxY protein
MSNPNLTTERTEITESKPVNQVTDTVIGAAIEVHRNLGPGLLESAYAICLCRELALRNVRFECEKPIGITYKGVKLDCGYKADLIVGGLVLVELKAVDQLTAVHEAQLLTYLQLTGLNVGLLINFNVRMLTHGIRRRVIGESTEVSL